MRKRVLAILLLVILSLTIVACKKKIDVEFSFTEDKQTIAVGESLSLDFTVTENYEVEFTLSKTDIVSIDGQTVLGLSEGEVIVTGTVKDTDVSDTITIVVEKEESEVIEVDSVTITGADTGVEGSTVVLTANVLPANATDKSVTWKSSDETLATVNNGTVTLLKEGEVTITVTASSKTATHTITITKDVVEVDSVTITGPNEGYVGDHITLTVSVLPMNANDKTFILESSDETLATIEEGVVVLLAEGEVTITATASGKTATHEIIINKPVVEAESIVITGSNSGFIGDTITLEAEVLPIDTTDKTVTWSVNINAYATVENGVVTLLREGVVEVTATVGTVSTTHEITIESVNALIGTVGYSTIQGAIDTALDNDVIIIKEGSYNEVLTINKSNLTFVNEENSNVTLTNLITIESGVENIIFDGFNFTADAQFKSVGTLKGFTFRNNHVYETNLAASAYYPINRIDVNAFIQFFATAGANVFGDINILNNTFEMINSDIISIARTMANTEINITGNTFMNFGVSAIRFDGGYNNGTYNITNNEFSNDELGSSSAITFRAFAPESSQTQEIIIEDNTFTNIGDVDNDRTGLNPGSGVITFNTFNTNPTDLSISRNEFNNTFNSIHIESDNGALNRVIADNTFTNSLGYIFFEGGNLATYTNNLYYDRLGVLVEVDRVVVTENIDYTSIHIEDPILDSFTINGLTAAEVTDEVSLTLTATPPYFLLDDVLWETSDETVATVDNGLVTMLAPGVVVITATFDGMSETHEITVTEKVVASILDTDYYTIASAIAAATENDVIVFNNGTFSESFTIDKPLTLRGANDFTTTLTGVITIASNLENITIDGFKLTAGFQVKSSGTLKGFTFTNNRVFDTNLNPTAYSPNSRLNVNAIISLYAGAGANVFGNIYIQNNEFNNIKSDIINIDRTMADTEINISNNAFTNYGVGAIRFDGGYNNGTYNITGNTFVNDEKSAYTAIAFRAYSPSSDLLQTINILNNEFTNIGNMDFARTDDYPGSAVIAASTFNGFNLDFNITENTFNNTHNPVHLRGQTSSKDSLIWDVDITNNTFQNSTGSIYFENGNIGNFTDNQILDINGILLTNDDLDITNTETLTMINVKAKAVQTAEYVILTYSYDETTEGYTIVEEFLTGTVGTEVVITPEYRAGFYTEEAEYSGTIKADGSLVIIIVYEKFLNTFVYNLELNGGNTLYATREEMVNDWVNDYNLFANTTYTIEELPMGSWALTNIHLMFYDARFRDKWLWVAEYLGVVGSGTNAPYARAIVSNDTIGGFLNAGPNGLYAFSYEVRGFMAGRKYIENALWQSADYSQIDLKFGFWSYLINRNQLTEFLATEEIITLPTEVYLENYDFLGWFDNPEFMGEPITQITEAMTLYAKFEERNPVEELTIVEAEIEMLKGSEQQLQVLINPVDAYNQLILYYTSDDKVLTVDDNGLVVAVNAGIATIRVTTHNGNVETEITITVYPNDDIELNFNEEFNGNIKVDEEFNVDVIPYGKLADDRTFVLEVSGDNVIEKVTDNLFKALTPGTVDILVYEGDDLIYTYKVNVQAPVGETRLDDLLELLAEANNAKVNGLNVIPYYTASQEWSDPRYESVNLFLFDDLVIDSTSYPADPTKFSNRLMDSVEFVLVHDTANLNGGLTNHGAFFANPANSIGIHYTTGDYGVLSSLPDEYVGWHAGDGTGTAFAWHQTGVTAPNNDKPDIGLSTDGYFTFNGEKSTVLAPKGKNGEILDESYFTFQGPTWDIVDGSYVIGSTWFATGQQARGVIASRGGNLNSIGIEMNVNRDADIVDTVQRTAKLVAHLLEENNLPNHRVVTHNTMDGKGDPYTLHNTIYDGTWYFDRFMEHVSIEREILANFSDATITFTSDSELVSSTGRVVVFPEFTTEVEYTIRVEIDGVSKSINLVSVIPGINTWNQEYGFFTPTQPWSKSDYRN